MRTRSGPVALLAVTALLAAPATARAELRRAEFTLPGMDCAYCNGAMSGAVKKVDGVESVELVPDKSTVVITLKADNKVTLNQLRRIIKSIGYEAKDAGVTARGRFTEAGTRFDLLNGTVLHVSSASDRTAGAIVEVTGTVKAGQDTEILTVASVR
jgi:copper chaperone CopZ